MAKRLGFWSLCVYLLALSGCGGSAGATRAGGVVTPKASTVAPSRPVLTGQATLVARTISSPTVATNTPTSVSTATTQPLLSPTPQVVQPTPVRSSLRKTIGSAGRQPAGLVSASMQPLTPVAGGNITASVITSGSVRRVEMYLGSLSPNAPLPSTYFLVRSTGGTWTGGGKAPSVPGEYHYSVGLYDASGVRRVITRDAWNIRVGTGATGISASFPSDIPLAPPFSWSNPTPAIFSALGRSVNGAEVVSTTRTDVSSSFVSQWYTTRLPRAGWTVDPSSVPAAGSTSFSIFATSGSANGKRVCIVQYGGSTVHIFYGTVI